MMNGSSSGVGSIERPAGWNLLSLVLVVGILLAPSVWMLANVAPLWKDVDAYAQVTAPPGVATILLYCPAYCFLARLPLYCGYLYHCWHAGLGLPSFAFFVKPMLSDAGVFLLLLAQHLALCASACLLLVAVTPSFAARIFLAFVWAANPLFYVWAHCVASEALSMILLLLLATAGLRIVQQRSRVPVRLWLLFALLFVLSMLTRHVNGLLGALLPLAFSFAAIGRFVPFRRQHSPGPKRTRRLGRRDLGRVLAAVVVGAASIALSSVTVRMLSRASGIDYHSTAGFTFMFRLGFFASLSPAERDEVVAHTAAAGASPEIRTLLNVYRNAPWGRPKLDIMSVLMKAQSLLPPATRENDNFPKLLNQTARAFLTSPSAPFLRAVRADLVKSQATTLADVIRSPFRHTVFFFSHASSMPRCANLATYRDTDPEVILAWTNTRYLGGGRKFSFRELLLGWAALALLFTYLARRRGRPLLAYAASLTIVGLLMMIANCFLNEYQVRYTLPMWELLIISATILAGATMRLFHVSRHSIGALLPLSPAISSRQ